MWSLLALVVPSWTEDRAADRAALTRMARGEHQAVSELYDRHARPVFSRALRVLQDRSAAEDVVRDVFTQAWTQASRYDTGRGAVGAWLMNMARSRAIDRLRATRNRPESNLAPDQILDVPDGSALQDLQLLSSEQVSAMKVALDALPALQRIALELAYFEGLTHLEIAERLEQPLGTVKTRIRQALIKLRDSLQALQA